MRIRNQIIMAMFLCAAVGFADEGKAWFQNVIQEAGFPKGSSIQFVSVPKDTILVSNTKLTNSVVLAKDGVVLFVDEKPNQDWAHPFQLLFVPKETLKPEVLFRGSAIPSFELRKPDGTKITNWGK